jgi:DNA-binding CsgD family transcriptional regulator
MVGTEPLGRADELGGLRGFLESGTDRARALLLEGEPGIGKTILWKAALELAARRGYRILTATPAEADAGLPFGVLGDLLDPLPEQAIALLSEPLRKALDVALFRAPTTQSPTDQLAVNTAFLRLLRQLTSEGDVLIAIDDVQWVDAPSMRVIAFAIHRLQQERVKFMGTARLPAVGDRVHALKKAIADEDFRRLGVGELPLNVIDDLLLHKLDRPLRKSDLDKVYSTSRGNPYFAIEIGRFIVERQEDLMVGEPLPMPASLMEALQGRVAGLPAGTRHLLVAVAATSRPDENLLRRLDPAAARVLEPALRASVLERVDGRLRFSHPLLGSVVYAMADAETRSGLHSQLAALVTDPEERARHLALASAGPDAAVADALEQAARSADARGAPDAATALAQQACDLTPAGMNDAITRRRIITAEYRMRAGDTPGARAMLKDVVDATPAGHRPPLEALRLLGSLVLGGDDLAEAERYLLEALAFVEADVLTAAAVERDLITILLQRGKTREALDHSARLTELAKTSGDDSLIAFARRSQGMTESNFGPVSPETRAMAANLAEGQIPAALDDQSGGLHPMMLWGALLKWSDDFPHARTLFKRALAETEGRDESLRAPVLFHLAELECWSGDWLLTAVYLRECEKSVLHTGQRSYACLPLNAQAMLHCCRGELEAGRVAGEEALATASTVGNDPYVCRALATLGQLALAGGDAVAANRWFDRLRTHPRHVGRIRTEGDEVEALVATGRMADAESVLTRFEGYDDPWERAIGARCSALIAAARGDSETSLAEFNVALVEHARLEMPLERARTLLAYAAVLRRTKQKRSAREALEESLAIFRSLGANAWLRRAEAELTRIAPPRTAAGELTPTEARIADLVAAGRTNKEVGAELFLSVKTIESNLSRVYEKLGVRSRSELVARLAASHETIAKR